MDHRDRSGAVLHREKQRVAGFSHLIPSSVVSVPSVVKKVWITEDTEALRYTEKSKGLQVLAF
ncbi:MAG: hypothetical protein HRU06_05840 [Oceanospirillaceae bacterium]|nr:hypothetical protein [Oceanospirillaceae bacterium]